jgi:secreted trypsin-like serine protease
MIRVSARRLRWAWVLATMATMLAAGCSPAAARGSGPSPSRMEASERIEASTFAATGALLIRPFGAPVAVCTATLIAPSVVITAAHCLAGSSAQPMEFLPALDVEDAQGGAGVAVRRAFVHPGFGIRATGSLHDIALVELASPLERLVPESLLDASTSNASLHAGAGVELVGYGRTSQSSVTGRRNAAIATIRTVATDEMTIGAPGEAQSCEGDSGGPAFLVGSDGIRRLAGIVSRSANDATECVDGTVHTRADAYAEWIAATLEMIERDARYEALRGSE